MQRVCEVCLKGSVVSVVGAVGQLERISGEVVELGLAGGVLDVFPDAALFSCWTVRILFARGVDAHAAPPLFHQGVGWNGAVPMLVEHGGAPERAAAAAHHWLICSAIQYGDDALSIS